MAEEESLKKDPIAYSKRLLHLAEHGDYEGLAAWIANDGSLFNGVHVCRSTGLRAQGSVNNRFLASGEFFAELGRVRPGVTVMVVVKGRGHLAPAAAQCYAHPGGACVLKQQGGNQITKTHQSEARFRVPRRGASTPTPLHRRRWKNSTSGPTTTRT
jgi:hypothetical protein